LNFVDNFAGLLVELRQAAASRSPLLADDMRREIDEIVATPSGNLEKIPSLAA
jgi:hypothetical protein